jgi:Cu/Ag efflux protein CusF
MFQWKHRIALAALAALLVSPLAYAADPVRGVVKAVNTMQGTVTLEDGTEFMISSQDLMAKLHEGDKVEVMYEEKDGQKVISSVEVTGQ